MIQNQEIKMINQLMSQYERRSLIWTDELLRSNKYGQVDSPYYQFETEEYGYTSDIRVRVSKLKKKYLDRDNTKKCPRLQHFLCFVKFHNFKAQFEKKPEIPQIEEHEEIIDEFLKNIDFSAKIEEIPKIEEKSKKIKFSVKKRKIEEKPKFNKKIKFVKKKQNNINIECYPMEKVIIETLLDNINPVEESNININSVVTDKYVILPNTGMEILNPNYIEIVDTKTKWFTDHTGKMTFNEHYEGNIDSESEDDDCELNI